MKVALPAFLPDQLPSGDALTVAQNVLPAQGGYRSVPGFQSISASLPAAFKGGASFISTDGTAYLFAGTASGLSRLAAGAWTSLVTGLTVTGRWKFAQFGDFVVCVNGLATRQVDLNTSTASLITGAPTATDVAVVGDYVILAQPNGDKLKVAWSAFNDHTGWTLGVDQAGDQPMLTGGEVMGVAGGEYGIILQRERIVRMTRTGDSSAPFQFDEISANFGCASKASKAQAGRTVFFLSDRGFMALEDGQSLRPIGNEKFDRTFRAALGEDDFERLWSAIDPQNTRVMWGIPGAPGTVWVYDWALDRATVLKLPFDGIFAGFENSLTLEEVAGLYANLDTMPYSLDDPRFSGGSPRLYFVQSGQVGVLSGANLTASFAQGDFAPFDTQIARIRAFWPITDAVSGVSFTVTARQRRGDRGVTRSGASMQASGRVPLQVTGKYLTVSLEIADPEWAYINGYEIEGSAGGLR